MARACAAALRCAAARSYHGESRGTGLVGTPSVVGAGGWQAIKAIS
ncbi:hypothetical protein [Streptomyces wuyuanensis]